MLHLTGTGCLALVVVCGAELAGGCKIQEADVNGDGAKEVVLENEFIRLVFSPDKGGGCIGVSSLDGQLSEKAFRYNIFDTLDWRTNYGEEQPFRMVPWAYQFEKQTPEEVVLRFSKQGTGEFQYFTIQNRIRLRAGESSFHSEYEVYNATEAMGKGVSRLWLHNWMTPTAGDATCYCSTERGVASRVFTADKGSDAISLSADGAPRGWMAVKQGDRAAEGAGVAFAMDWRYLQWMYFWYSKTDVTPEWRYIPVQLDAGKSFKTEVEILVFPRLRQVDHAQNGLVFDSGLESVVTAEGERKMRIAFDRPRTVAVRLSVRSVKRPDDRPPYDFELVNDRSVAAAAGWRVEELPYEIRGLAPGDYVLKCVVTESGRQVADFERRFDVKEQVKDSAYVYRPIEKKAEAAIARQKTYFPYQPSREIVTPHFAWYTPYYKGRVRMLFLGNYMANYGGPDNTSREVVELAQRLDCEYTAPCLTADGYAAIGDPWTSTVGDPDPREYLKHLPEYLGPRTKYDVIVIRKLGVPYGKQSDYFWRNIPAQAKARMAELVKAGAGLVLLDGQEITTDYGELNEIVKEVKATFEKEPSLPPPPCQTADWWNRRKKDKKVIWGQCGKGRVLVVADQWTDLFSVPGDPMSEVILWAAGMEPSVRIESIALENPKLTWEDWSQQRVTVKFNARENLGTLRAELNWYAEKPVADFFRLEPDGKKNPYYRPDWASCQTVRVPCKVECGSGTWVWPAARLPGGEGLLRVRLLAGKRVVTSSAMQFTMPPAVTVESIMLDRDVLKPMETVNGRVLLANKGANRHEVVCRVRAHDIYDRELHRQATPLTLEPGATAEVALSFNVGRPVSVLQTVRADVLEKHETLASSITEYTVPSLANRFDDYIAFCWCHGGPVALRRLQDIGFDADYHAFSRSSNPNYTRRRHHEVVSIGMRLFPCTMGNALGFDWQEGERLVRKVSFSDPKYLEGELRELTLAGQIGAQYGAYAYNLADEPSLGAWETSNQFDWSEWSLANFKKWLAERYGTIEKLNAEWDTNHKSFEEVQPAVESEVRDKANLAPWQDFRAHMNHEVANMYKVCRKGLQSGDPEVLVGICGVNDGHPYSGFDWWELTGVCDSVNTYTSCAMLRSLMPNGKFSRYEGYKDTYLKLWDNAWRNFFEGQQGYAYWINTIFMKPDYTFAEPNARPVREILATFRNGIGKLWMETQRQDKDIVFHYSQPSIHTCWMMKYWQKEVNNSLKFYRDNRWGMEQAFYDASLDVSYMAYGQIEQGLLAQRKPKVLVLPLSISLSPKEVEEIEAFVRGGGTLVTDICCGLRDDHGKPYPRAALDEVFGIERDPGYKDTLCQIRGSLGDEPGETDVVVEKGIRARTAKAWTRIATKDVPAGTPLVFVNQYGSGKAVYLGFSGLYAQARQAKPQLTRLYREVWENVVGLRGRYRMEDRGVRVTGRTLVHSGGDGEFVGFYRDLSYVLPPGKELADATDEDVREATRPAEFVLPARRHVYDVLAGRYVGEVDRVPCKLVPGRGVLYAVLPYRVKSVRLYVPPSARPGEIVPVRIALHKEGEGRAVHVYHLEVVGPSGEKLAYYRKNCAAPDGTASFELQFPLNAPGRYALTARDVATGRVATAAVNVK